MLFIIQTIIQLSLLNYLNKQYLISSCFLFFFRGFYKVLMESSTVGRPDNIEKQFARLNVAKEEDDDAKPWSSSIGFGC